MFDANETAVKFIQSELETGCSEGLELNFKESVEVKSVNFKTLYLVLYMMYLWLAAATNEQYLTKWQHVVTKM